MTTSAATSSPESKTDRRRTRINLVEWLWPEPWLERGRKGRCAAFALCVCTGLIAGLAPFVSLREGEQRHTTTVVPTHLLHHDGLSYFVSARDAGVRAVQEAAGTEWRLGPFDSNADPKASRHQVQVNGIMLSEPHSPHAAIVREGGGRYSFWAGATIDESGVYLSLPPQLQGELGTSEVAIAWHLVKTKGLQHWLTLAVAWSVAGALLTLGWRALGSLPCAVAIALAMLPWAAWLGVAIPDITHASAYAIQCLAVQQSERLVQLALLVAVIAWIASFVPALRDGASDRAALKHGGVLLMISAVGLFLLYLFATWVAPAPVTSWTGDGPASAPLGGRLPFSDASAWYLGSLAVGQGYDVEWVARRPVHALLRAGQLALAGGHYQWSVAFQALLLGGAVGVLTMVWARVASVAAGLVLMVALFKYGSGFAPSYLSEASGLLMATLGLAYALIGWKEDNFRWRLVGAAFFGLAAAIRPGPIVVLAVLPVCEFLLSRHRRIGRTVTSAAAILVVLGFSSLSFRMIANSAAAANANSAHTLLGLAMGTTWNQATNRFFEEDSTRTAMSTKEVAREMKRVAWERFRADPGPAFGLMWENLKSGTRALLLDSSARIFGQPALAALPWVISAGVIGWFGIKRQPWAFFILGCALAVLLSLPLIWSDGGWRGTTAGLPLIFCALAAAVARPNPACKREPVASAALHSLACLVVLLIGVGMARHLLGEKPAPSDPLVVRVGYTPAVSVVQGMPKPNPFGLLEAQPEDVISTLQQTGLTIYHLDETLSLFKPPYLMALVAPDRVRPERARWIVIPGLSATSDAEIRILKITEMSDGYISRADEWTLVK